MVLIRLAFGEQPFASEGHGSRDRRINPCEGELAPANRLELAKSIRRKREGNPFFTRRRKRKRERITDARFRLNRLFGGALGLKRKRSVVESGGQL